MIKSILGGKSKNLCDVAYLLTLPLDKTFEGHGYLRVLINAEPNTTYTFSRENANQITDLGNTYLAISAYDDISHNNWLSHHVVQSLNNKSATLTTGSEGKLWILFGRNVYTNYWQKNLNPFGYIQLELGSTATEYVPHELTSYKSIMKVSDGHFVTSFDERMPCKTKNLFDIPLIEGYPSNKNYGAGTLRTFTIGTYVVGMTRRNNYEPSNVTNFNVSKNSISVKSQSSGYGINVPLILTVGQTYTISCIADNNFYPAIGISYYKEDGTFITSTEVETITNNPIKLFTVPENTYYTVITFYGRYGHSYMFSNIQLELGTTATDYVPYGYV